MSSAPSPAILIRPLTDLLAARSHCRRQCHSSLLQKVLPWSLLIIRGYAVLLKLNSVMILQAAAPVATWFNQIENHNSLVQSSSGQLQDPGPAWHQQRIAKLEMAVAER